MDVLPALRDAEGDLENWRRSPLRPLIEDAFKDINPSDLKEISETIKEATDKIVQFGEVQELEDTISSLFLDMSGPKQDINPRLGFSQTDPIIVAVPTGHGDAVRKLANLVNTVYCPNIREGRFFAVADAYEHWADVEEQEVIALLKEFQLPENNQGKKNKMG